MHAALTGGDDEAPGLNRARPHQNVPMQPSRRGDEGGGDGDDRRARFGEGPV